MTRILLEVALPATETLVILELGHLNAIFFHLEPFTHIVGAEVMKRFMALFTLSSNATLLIAHHTYHTR
jgi:hypothetical protein